MGADHHASYGPLAGVRVVEMAGLGPAPMAAMLLSEMGADVVRVDRPTPPPFPDVLDRGRRSVVIDLKHPAGPEAVLRLAERAHILIEGFRPTVMERLGLGPEQVHARSPALVYGRMTGWGQTGPRAAQAGHDLNYIGLTGALSAIGPADGPPQVPLNLIGDFGGGALYLVTGVLAALRHADSTGRGQVVDAAIVDGTTHLAAMIWAERRYRGWTDERGGNLLDGGAPFYDVYRTADGGWIAVGAIEPQFYEQLTRALDLAEWAGRQDDRAHWPDMRAAFARVFATRTRAHWEKVFDSTDACVTPVLNWAEAVRDAHLQARGVHLRLDDGDVPAPAPRFSRTPSRVARPAAGAGPGGRQVFAEWGVSGLERLLADGAVLPDAPAPPGTGRPV